MTKSKTKQQRQIRILSSDALTHVQGGVISPRDSASGMPAASVTVARDAATGQGVAIISPRDPNSGLPTG